MTHSFDVKIAESSSVNAAILLQSIEYWCAKNKANEKHYHDEKYWTYNSISAWKKLFPYLGESAIKSALALLVEKKLIVTGKYSENPYDHTNWYSAVRLGENSQSTLVENSQSSLSVNKQYIHGVFDEVWKQHRQTISNKSPRNSLGDKTKTKSRFTTIFEKLSKRYEVADEDLSDFIFGEVQATWKPDKKGNYYIPNLINILDYERFVEIIEEENE